MSAIRAKLPLKSKHEKRYFDPVNMKTNIRDIVSKTNEGESAIIRATRAPNRTNPSKRKMMTMGEEGGIFSPEKGHNGDRSVYFAMKAIKQKELENPYEQRSSNIFEGVKFFFNSVKNPDDLAKIVLENGGYRIITRGIEKFTHYVTNEVTAGQQEEEAKRSRPRDHHWVTEAWIMESVRAGRRLSEHAFSPFQRKSGDIGMLLGPYPSTSTNKDPVKRREAKSEHVSIEEDPGGFLQHFLANSRLHYIGTWRERALEHYLLMKSRTVPTCELSYRAPWLRDSSSSSSRLDERVVLHADTGDLGDRLAEQSALYSR